MVLRSIPFFLIVVLLSPEAGHAQAAPENLCERLVAAGQTLVEDRPVQHTGNTDEEGRPTTPNARDHRDLTARAVALWQQASRSCREAAARERDAANAAYWTSLAYWAQGQALELDLRYDEACDVFERGVEAVAELDGAHSRHVVQLNDLVAFCAHSRHGDPAAMVRAFETSLDIRIAAYGARDPRIVEGLTQLAVAIPYAVAEGGDLAKAAAPEAASAKSRIEQLYRLAVEIVEEHPSPPETVKMAVAQYCGWLIGERRMEDCAPLRQLEARVLRLNSLDSDS